MIYKCNQFINEYSQKGVQTIIFTLRIWKGIMEENVGISNKDKQGSLASKACWCWVMLYTQQIFMEKLK